MISSRPFARSHWPRPEQRRRDRAIVDAFEKPKAADVRLMKRIIVRIIARHDSADDFSLPPREEKRRVAMLKKGMFFRSRNSFRSSRSGGTQAGSSR